MIDNALEGNNGDTSATLIVLQHNKHLSSELVRNGPNSRVGEEIYEIPLSWMVVIKLRSDPLDVAFELSHFAGRYGTPPFICDLAAGENNDHAVGVIIISLVLDINW